MATFGEKETIAMYDALARVVDLVNEKKEGVTYANKVGIPANHLDTLYFISRIQLAIREELSKAVD